MTFRDVTLTICLLYFASGLIIVQHSIKSWCEIYKSLINPYFLHYWILGKYAITNLVEWNLLRFIVTNHPFLPILTMKTIIAHLKLTSIRRMHLLLMLLWNCYCWKGKKLLLPTLLMCWQTTLYIMLFGTFIFSCGNLIFYKPRIYSMSSYPSPMNIHRTLLLHSIRTLSWR